MEFQQITEKGPGPKSILCPALGPGRPPSMKDVLVFKDIFVIRTLEYTTVGRHSRFAYAKKWQRVVIFTHLNGGISKPGNVEIFSDNYSKSASGPFVVDASLAGRFPELIIMVQKFLSEQQKAGIDLSGNQD